MNVVHRKVPFSSIIWLPFLVVFMLVVAYWPVYAAPPPIGFGSPSELISSINAYRAQNGLPAYQTNSTLMQIAQAQSDYQASISTVTHTGPGGSRPIDRAYAAGYGGGNTVFVSEIIYGGTHATVETAMSWWKGSSVHNSSMLSGSSQEIGAGAASSGGSTYFTVVMGYVSGGVTSSSSDGATSDTDGQSPSSGVIFNPVIIAEPNEDGSIIHVVQAGQTLWSIAAVYDVPLERLQELNDLAGSILIQPGQEIIVQPPEPTPLPTIEDTETSSATEISPTPTRFAATATPSVTKVAALPAIESDPSNGQENPSAPAPDGAERTSHTTRDVFLIAGGMVLLYALLFGLAAMMRSVDDSPGSRP